MPKGLRSKALGLLVRMRTRRFRHFHPKPPSFWEGTKARFTIRTEIITNENLEILFCFRFRNGKANKFPQIFFRICFRNGHVGHAQATAAGHTYEAK